MKKIALKLFIVYHITNSLSVERNCQNMQQLTEFLQMHNIYKCVVRIHGFFLIIIKMVNTEIIMKQNVFMFVSSPVILNG